MTVFEPGSMVVESGLTFRYYGGGTRGTRERTGRCRAGGVSSVSFEFHLQSSRERIN